ncbi:DUF1987 domain-containing protein [Desulfoscipio gibsoniae]|uniref:SiaC family regulatory phosphoprotein domain-containing protein n=1 Tax=Desulfoscipio gibsoniae DSM 7213 TaxID=767817 RepID=R4KIF7_9FIRM|nr:DUF1987 domain-containing protein [Desulfoscipio gibsoniae]AGL00320.1 protein of unknown function (DUF1987) [Desulfoscipio gibsoniae DSM 7213]
MEKLHIDQTKGTPKIDFDPDTNKLLLWGQSYPENAFKFYEPIFNWVNGYLYACKQPVLIEVNLSYVNTSSTKCILMLLEKFENAYQGGAQITLNWYYDAENESELECAEEFKEDVTFPFYIISLPQDAN